MPRLTNWENIADANTRVVAVIGDSTAQLDADGPVGTWPRLLREKMERRWGISGTGMIGTWFGDWSFTTGGDAWTNGTVNDTWSQGPYHGVFSPRCRTMFANGATKTATLTKPHWVNRPVSSIKIYVVDGPTSANFSYRIDGGSWTNVSFTWIQDSEMKIITISSSVTSTVQVRAADAAGTAVNLYLSGMELITSSTGATLHNLTASGESIYWSTTNLAGVADLNGWIDLIQPDLLFISFTNDLNSNVRSQPSHTTNIPTKLDTIMTRQGVYGHAVPMTFWGQDRDSDGVDSSVYAWHNGVYSTAASNHNTEFIDLYTRYGNYSTVNALGYMADGLHPSDLGSIEIAKVAWRLVARGTGNARVRTS